MPRITLTLPTSDIARLDALKTPDPARNSRGEVVSFLLNAYHVTAVPGPVAGATPAPPSPAATLPIRAAIVIPADQLQYAGDSALLGAVDSWLMRFRLWLGREAGLTYDYQLRLIRSRYTRAELATGEGRSWLDDCGQGGWETIAWDSVARQELGWATGPRRETMVILNWGGWAGGRYDPQADAGGAIVGDWQLRAQVTHTADACCAAKYGATSGACISPGAAWSHEMLHCMGVHCHDGDVLPDGSTLAIATNPLEYDWPGQPDKRGTVLTPGQLAELRRYNVPLFLREVV